MRRKTNNQIHTNTDLALVWCVTEVGRTATTLQSIETKHFDQEIVRLERTHLQQSLNRDCGMQASSLSLGELHPPILKKLITFELSFCQVPQQKKHSYGFHDSLAEKKLMQEATIDSHSKHYRGSTGSSTGSFRKTKKLARKKYGPFNICQLMAMQLPKKRRVARFQKVKCITGSAISHETVPRCTLMTF